MIFIKYGMSFVFLIADVRLVGGMVEFQGRVEIKDGQDWKTICSSNFTDEDAQVLCYMLGYPRYEHNYEIQYIGN